MIKRITLLVMIFILSLPASALAAESGSGMIEGRVVNGTAGSGNVSDQDVTLKTYINDAEAGSATTKTDAEGRFVFDGLSTSSGYSYQVIVTFQQAEYYGEMLSFNEEETSKSVEVIVYDSTASAEAIRVTTAHTVVYVEQGSLRVEEYFLFVNEADRTYIGSKEVAAGTKETLRFSIPSEVTDLQYFGALMECCVYSSEDGFVDTMPVLPGSKEVVYSYRVDYSSEAYTFSQRVNYPISEFNLLVQSESVEITSDQLTKGDPLSIEGSVFSNFSGTNLASGENLVVQLSGLPKADNQGVIVWTTVALVVLVAGFGFGYLRRRKRLQPVRSEDSLAQKKQGLLAELAQLDNDFESGKVPEGVYHRLRTERKAQLVELMRRSKE